MSLSSDPSGEDLRNRVRSIEGRLIDLRRDLHRNPELGFDTPRTTAKITFELQRIGLMPKTGIGRSGVVAELSGGTPGPMLLIRADFDALPIKEETGLPYASDHPGRMHACGHDIHTSTLVGVAEVLAGVRDKLAGSARFVFQPAEEIPDSGALAMIADGAADGASLGLAFHNWPELDAGRFAYTPGTAMGSGDEFDIVVRGRQSHAARPATAIDPIVTAAAMIMQLQTAVSRFNDPQNPAVLTIGAISGGTTYNVIPETCSFRGTIRCLSRNGRAGMKEALFRICQGVATAMGATCEIDFIPGVPPLVNDPALLERVVASVGKQFGRHKVKAHIGLFETEDFSYFSERIPSAHLLIGSGQPDRRDRLHSASYQPDERCIGYGVEALSRAALDLLV